MKDLANRFLSFDEMMGAGIIKLLYYIGMVVIAVGTIGTMFAALGSIGDGFFSALTGFVLAPIFGLVGLLFWRFMCEIYLLFFKISDDLSAIKRRGDSKGG